MKLMNKFEYQKARQEFSKCLKIDTTNFVALNQRFICSFYLQDFDQAKKDLLKTKRLYSDSAGVYHNLGLFYDTLDSISIAKLYYEKAISLDSSLAKTFSNLGVLALKENNIELALKYQNKSLLIDPNDRETYINRGALFHYINKNDLAILDFNRAVKLSKLQYEKAISYNYRAMYFRDIKEYQRSIDDFNVTIKLSPPIGDLFYYRGLSYYAIKDYEAALKDFKRANELGKNTDEMIEDCKKIIKTGV